MTAQYLITLPDGTADGPYTEEELLDMMDADELGAGTICEDMATRRRCRVRDLFKVIPPGNPLSVAAEDGDEDGPEEAEHGHYPSKNASHEPAQTAAAVPAPARWVPAPLKAPPAGVSLPAAVAVPLRTLYTGHPSFWHYWRSFVASLALMAGGWYAGKWPEGGWWLAAGWLAGGGWLALTLLRRSSVEYKVTTRRVEVQRGFFSKSSQEIRIPDIRAINITKSGFKGLLGVGDLVFASSAGGEDDVVFHQTGAALLIKNRVRQLQDRSS